MKGLLNIRYKKEDIQMDCTILPPRVRAFTLGITKIPVFGRIFLLPTSKCI
jgi:hypothetical protein